MRKKQPIPPGPDDPRPAGGVTRRSFVAGGAAALAAGVAGVAGEVGSGHGAAAAPTAGGIDSSGPSPRPNFVLLITDQERFPQHWPEGWAERNLPNRQRLTGHGLTFTQAFCNTAMCSPSRATLFTGLYPAQHHVEQTLQTGDKAFYAQHTLQPATPNLAHLLADAGYDVQYRGKWHISKDPTGQLDVQSPRDLRHYGFHGWLPPDGGQDALSTHFGGGDTDYDGEYARQAARFLREQKADAPRPFALVVALINPHDIMSYPLIWNQPSASDIPPYQGSDNYGKEEPGCFRQGIDLPPTWDESTDQNFKPAAQAQSTAMWAGKLGPITDPRAMREYVNFYAFLQAESDRHVGTVLDALESVEGLAEKTIVIRLADHGEMGLSHGGMRQKAYNAYEETIHVPLVVSSPGLFDGPRRTDALASLIDLMPTLATLADVPGREGWELKGRDLTPILRDARAHPDQPPRPVQDAILFTTDEVIGTDVVTAPSRIRCLRDARWKLVMYFDPDHEMESQWELYDLRHDPLEVRNMADPRSPWYDPSRLGWMKDRLARKMAETGTTPKQGP